MTTTTAHCSHLQERLRALGKTPLDLAKACGHGVRVTYYRLSGERAIRLEIAQDYARQVSRWLGRQVTVDELFPPDEGAA